MIIRTAAGVAKSDLSEFQNLVRLGFALIEVPRGEKGPASSGWNLPENAITAPEDIVKLEGKNVGLAHAYCIPKPTCAIDIDDYRRARQWLSENGVDLKSELLKPTSLVLASGKRQSIKLLFKMPEGSLPKPTRQIMSADNTVILEFRCATRTGTTVHDLLPPSVHPTGSSYRWIGHGSLIDLPTIPNKLFDIWHSLDETAQKNHQQKLSSATSGSPRDRALIEDALAYINADCGYIVWRNVVWSLLSSGWQDAGNIAQTWSETAPDQFDQEKFNLLINSYNPKIHRKHSLGTVYYFARKGGWNG